MSKAKFHFIFQQLVSSTPKSDLLVKLWKLYCNSVFSLHFSSLEDVLRVEFMYLVFTRMPGESYLKRVRSLLLCLFNVSRVLTPSFVVFISWSVLLQKWIGTSNYKTMCILPWLTVVWPFLSFFSFSFLSIVCVYKKILSAAFCRAHCALDLAKDHAP